MTTVISVPLPADVLTVGKVRRNLRPRHGCGWSGCGNLRRSGGAAEVRNCSQGLERLNGLVQHLGTGVHMSAKEGLDIAVTADVGVGVKREQIRISISNGLCKDSLALRCTGSTVPLPHVCWHLCPVDEPDLLQNSNETPVVAR